MKVSVTVTVSYFKEIDTKDFEAYSLSEDSSEESFLNAEIELLEEDGDYFIQDLNHNDSVFLDARVKKVDD